MKSESRNELADRLHAMGDAAYCRACDLAKRELCLGEEYKIKTGAFTYSNLKALEEVRAEFGRANGLWEAEKLIRESVSETGTTGNLRALLLGLECENVETLVKELENPLLFRALGERIARSAKLGAHLLPPDTRTEKQDTSK